jgi:hypothetical protein
MPEPLPLAVVCAAEGGTRSSGGRAVAEALRQLGFGVREAGTAAEALRLLAETPELVLLGGLPDMSPAEIRRRIEEEPGACPVVLELSANRDPLVTGGETPDHSAFGLSTTGPPTTDHSPLTTHHWAGRCWWPRTKTWCGA